MAIALAILELGSLFAVATLLFMWAQPTMPGWPDSAHLLAQSLAMAVACLVSFYYNDLYDLRIVRSLTDFVPRLLQGFAIAFFLLAAFYVFFPGQGVDGGLFLTVQLVVALTILLVRTLCYRLFSDARFAQKLLLIGDSPLTGKIVDEIDRAPWLRYAIPGRISESATPGRPAPDGDRCQVLGDLQQAVSIIEREAPDRVVVALAERRGKLPVWPLLWSRLNGLVVDEGVDFYEQISQKLPIESLNPSYLLFSKDFNKPRTQLVLRRLVSLTVALLGLVVATPLMLLTAIAIKLDSPGPVFFLQDRAGLGGKTFRLIKFRTMTGGRPASGPDADASVWHRDDSRVTRVGRWLRPLRLDELPQFINVLRGDMDLVGPRPEMAENVPAMTEEIPFYSLRTTVRPGVTGWAQIRSGYALTREQVMEKLRYDLYYIKHMSLTLDLRILLDTVKTVLFIRGT